MTENVSAFLTHFPPMKASEMKRLGSLNWTTSLDLHYGCTTDSNITHLNDSPFMVSLSDGTHSNKVKR